MSKKVIITFIVIGVTLLTIGMTLALKSMKPIHINVISGLIILLGTFFGLFGKQLQDKSSSEKSDRILQTGESTIEKVDSLTFQNQELANKIEVQAQTIDSLRVENSDLYSKLADASKDIYTKITGGESYCYILPLFGEKGKPQFILKHEGNTALKNVQITIEDLARRMHLIKNSNQTDYFSPTFLKIMDETSYGFEHASLYPQTAVVNISIPIEEGQNDINLRIWIHLDNGSLFQTLEVKNFQSKNRSLKSELRRGNQVLKTL
jgi:hypothetical protein